MEVPQHSTGESPERKALIDVAVKDRRFASLFGRSLAKPDVREALRRTNQARYFHKKIVDGLESFGLRIVKLVGQSYDPGMAVSAPKVADFGPDDQLNIDQMVEPLVMRPDGLVRGGIVLLAKIFKL